MNLLELGRGVLHAEAQAIAAAAARLGESFEAAVRLIAASGGSVIVSGIGKSGHVARKIAATFSGTGTPALFLHPSEAAHGDIGICRPGDVSLLVSRSGATEELCALLPMLRERSASVIAIVGYMDSPIAKAADIALNGSVLREADAHNFAPSCSTAVALALGDALAFGVMQVRQLTADEVARNHPGGSIGRLFQTKVGDVMSDAKRTAWVTKMDTLADVLTAVTRFGLGCACVVSGGGELEGLITDGDVRRALQRGVNVRETRAGEIMTREPITIGSQVSLYHAMRTMEDRPSQISVLPVVENGRCVGVIRLHDIYRAGIL